MAGRLTKAKRAKLTSRAMRLSARGKSAVKIAEEIGLTEKSVRKLIDDELALRGEHRDHDKERAIARYEEVIRVSWERLLGLEANSTAATGLLNTIRASQERIDKITGAEAPLKVQDVEEEIVIVWEDLDGPLELSEGAEQTD